MLLEGKNIIITGAGRGIGAEVAKACAKEGAKIGLTARSTDELNNVKTEIEQQINGAIVLIKTADITEFKEVEKIFKEFSEEMGLIDGVIANAGASKKGATHEFDPDMFLTIIKVNILGVFNTFKAAFPHLNKENKKDKARFIITGSAAYPNAMPQFAGYTATKYATVGLQKALAAEYKRENISFNQVLPTMVDTRLLRGKKARDGTKGAGIMDPWDLNDYYLFLLSPDASRMNDELLISSDIEAVKKIILESPQDKKENWDIFKAYLEENYEKLYNNVKKLGKFIEFLLNRIK